MPMHAAVPPVAVEDEHHHDVDVDRLPRPFAVISPHPDMSDKSGFSQVAVVTPTIYAVDVDHQHVIHQNHDLDDQRDQQDQHRDDVRTTTRTKAR